jgi:hypothetical protein
MISGKTGGSISCISLSIYVGPWPLFEFLNPIHSRSDSLDGGSARRKAATYTVESTNTEYTNTDIHASSGIRTHDPSVWASEDYYDGHSTSFTFVNFHFIDVYPDLCIVHIVSTFQHYMIPSSSEWKSIGQVNIHMYIEFFSSRPMEVCWGVVPCPTNRNSAEGNVSRTALLTVSPLHC